MDIKTVTAEELLQTIRQKQSFFSLRLRKHPEQARIFRKYGPPEETAALLRAGSSDVFFDNGTMCMTGTYLLDRDEPESLMKLSDIRAAYPEMRGKGEYLVVHDRWGDMFRYPFAVGSKQVFKIGILIDKIRKAAPQCRTSHRPEDLEYIRQQAEKLPE